MQSTSATRRESSRASATASCARASSCGCARAVAGLRSHDVDAAAHCHDRAKPRVLLRGCSTWARRQQHGAAVEARTAARRQEPRDRRAPARARLAPRHAQHVGNSLADVVRAADGRAAVAALLALVPRELCALITRRARHVLQPQLPCARADGEALRPQDAMAAAAVTRRSVAAARLGVARRRARRQRWPSRSPRRPRRTRRRLGGRTGRPRLRAAARSA